MSFKDGKVPPPSSTEGKRIEKMVNQTPFLKKMRAQSRGDSYSEISTDSPSEEYKANYDQIDWTKKLDEPKRYRVKINGKYTDE